MMFLSLGFADVDFFAAVAYALGTSRYSSLSLRPTENDDRKETAVKLF